MRFRNRDLQAPQSKENSMSEKFKPIADNFYAAPQVTAADISDAKAQGITLIINNRPDGEAPGQPSGAEIEKAAMNAGVDYLSLPVGAAGISHEMLDQFMAAIDATDGAALAFCMTGTRSTILRAFALARAGHDIDELINEASASGFNIAGQRSVMEALAAG